ncbi:hypothetical protein F2Q68_00045455 [Brassica cretica]|uniref:Exocyst complex component SEC5 n=1 Tax=Brassica cretica TaxID=69181 RepID=A0A8S9LJD5_BRACR|nr:hypothetical protein F2Q68_00045455 [Brassica cretica]
MHALRVLLPTSHFPRIIPELVEMIRDLEEFLAFPWGRLVFMEAVPQIKEVVPQLEPEVVIESDSESETECGDSQADEEEDEAVIKPATPPAAVRYCVNPAHVKALDEDEKTEVISFFEDTSHSSDDLTWDDEVVDVVVDELVRLIKEDYTFKNTMFVGGLTAADLRIMSSDDEDELLQMALKEQSQRDLTYQKPPSSSSRKPVANLVQQPRQQKPAPPKKSAAAAAVRKPSMDDDDESEVELLSISSGDDDLERDRETGGGGAGKGRGSDVRERGGRAKKEDDGAWDGEEPDCWKRVNEAESLNSRSLVMVEVRRMTLCGIQLERCAFRFNFDDILLWQLARRVRDMRESRTAPVVQKLEDKSPAPGKKVVLTSLQSLPRGMECIDPLKLGIIDNKTLRLITERSGSPSKSEKVDNTLREKLIYFSDNFDPKLFLSRIHQHTSAADLEAGALGLKSSNETVLKRIATSRNGEDTSEHGMLCRVGPGRANAYTTQNCVQSLDGFSKQKLQRLTVLRFSG